MSLFLIPQFKAGMMWADEYDFLVMLPYRSTTYANFSPTFWALKFQWTSAFHLLLPCWLLSKSHLIDGVK